MSLSEKLSTVSQYKKTKLCKIGTLLAGSILSDADKQSLEAVLNTNPDDPTRINNSDIGRILREEGHDISNSAVDRHRRRDCACSRINNGK